MSFDDGIQPYQIDDNVYPIERLPMEPEVARIPDFMDSLDKMRALHLRKNQDYAQDSNPYSNFDFTEFVLSHFKSDLDKSFVWPIATKLARLANLLDSKEPNNESIEDSFLDIAVYVLLWKARRSSMFAHQPQK